jgi:hypothetical protein
MGVYSQDDTWWIDYYVGGQRRLEAVGSKKLDWEEYSGHKSVTKGA